MRELDETEVAEVAGGWGCTSGDPTSWAVANGLVGFSIPVRDPQLVR